jgi:hypothetical protein
MKNLLKGKLMHTESKRMEIQAEERMVTLWGNTSPHNTIIIIILNILKKFYKMKWWVNSQTPIYKKGDIQRENY